MQRHQRRQSFPGQSLTAAARVGSLIYATRGYKFKRKKSQESFGKNDWYKDDCPALPRASGFRNNR